MSFDLTPKNVVIGIWLAIAAFLFACNLNGADLTHFMPPVGCLWLATGCAGIPLGFNNWHKALLGPLVWL